MEIIKTSVKALTSLNEPNKSIRNIVAPENVTTTNFNHPLHLLRGLAIIAIVGAHAWSFMIFWTGSLDSFGLELLFSVTEMLFHGSTLYFALISGVLFSLVLAKRSWKQFYLSKLFNVVLPYITMSLFYFSLYGGWQSDLGLQEFFLSLWLGKASIHMWYIPVLMILYLLTPLLWKIVTSSKLKWVALLLIVIPLFISRSPFPDFIKLQTFIYFVGAYTTGIFVGCHLQQVLHWIGQHITKLYCVLFGLCVTIIISYFIDYIDIGWFSVRQSLIYMQKLIISGVALYGLHSFFGNTDDKHAKTTINQKVYQDVYSERKQTLTDSTVWKVIGSLGDMAFSIYFLHVFFMGWIIYAAQNWLMTDRNALEIALYGLVSLIGSIVLSVIISMIAQKLISKHSRKIIGA